LPEGNPFFQHPHSVVHHASSMLRDFIPYIHHGTKIGASRHVSYERGDGIIDEYHRIG